jgi:prevent-host-death family protein
MLDKVKGGNMTIVLKSTEAQQNFGAMLDRAPTEEDVIVERDGTPRVAIVNYRRYQTLMDAERELIRLRLQQASAAASQRAVGLTTEEVDRLIYEARDEAYDATGS